MASVLDSVRTTLTFPFFRNLSPVWKAVVALGVYAIWTVLTWVLEGRIQTFHRPDAVADRLVYTGLVNVIVGTVLALILVRQFTGSDFISRSGLGFQSLPRAIIAALIGGVFGFVAFILQNPAVTDPVILLNVFAQALPVSIAEVIVCFVLVGGSVAALARQRGLNRYLADGSGLTISSLLFGVYHFAHSQPFNSVEMVSLLTVVGVGTGLIYFGGRTFYGALMFHNFMVLIGIVSYLAASDQILFYQQLLPTLLAIALAALIVVIGMERIFVRDSDSAPPSD